jgi:aromatase
MAAHTDNSVVINAPRDFVWERMMDVPSWPNLFSEYAAAEVISEDGNTIQFRLTTHPDPDYDGKVWSWVSERTADPQSYSSKSKRIETGPFEYMNIDWEFEEVEGGTKMRWVQDFSMKPEAPADDATAEDYMNKNTKTQMGVIKERLEKAAAETGAA